MNQLENTLTSLEVAEMVGKDHKHVLADIRRIIEHLGEPKSGLSSKLAESKIALSEYFIEDTYINTQNKELPCYRLTKKGCELFSTRMTGAKGTQFAVAYIERFNQMEEHIKQQSSHLSTPEDDYVKRLRAEAMSQNAKNRAAQLLQELSRDATSTVNKALLQDKAVEVLTGEKLLEMPELRQKMVTAEDIAKKLGVLSKAEKPHASAISQLIQTQLSLMDNEIGIFPESKGNWSGTVVKYTESVIDKVQDWLEENNFPSIIAGQENKNYHIRYRNIK